MVERTSRVVETMAACGSANDEPGQGRCPRDLSHMIFTHSNLSLIQKTMTP